MTATWVVSHSFPPAHPWGGGSGQEHERRFRHPSGEGRRELRRTAAKCRTITSRPSLRLFLTT